MASVTRTGENILWRWLLFTWAPVLYSILSITLSQALLHRIDGLLVTLAERESYSLKVLLKERFEWRVSDITTIVSAAVVIIRLVGSSWSTLVIWRCIMVLLEKEGLKAGQIGIITFLRVYLWPWKGRYSACITLITLLMIPSLISAPLITGSIDWQPEVEMEPRDSVLAGFGGPIPAGYVASVNNWKHFFDKEPIRKEVVFAAIMHAILPWSDDDGTEIETTSRYIAREDAFNNTLVSSVSMPYIEVHEISWDKSPWDKDILEIFKSHGANYTYIGDEKEYSQPLRNHAPGSSMLFGGPVSMKPEMPRDTNTGYDTTNTTAAKIPAKPITMKLVVTLSKQAKSNSSCTEVDMSAKDWGNLPMAPTDVYAYPDNSMEFVCFAIGTVRLTAGIKTFHEGRYINSRVIEGKAGGDNDTLLDDPWAETALRMLPDLMTIPSMNQIRSEKNLTDFSRKLIARSYIAARSVLAPYPPAKYRATATEIRQTAPKMTAKMPVQYLKGIVSAKRVYSWLALALASSFAGLILVIVERRCKRMPTTDATLSALFTDTRNILNNDGNGLSNMSYLTKKDKEALGSLSLQPVPTDKEKKVFALTGSGPTH